ncbi:1-acyl-sn-glycerol-3-phosphate acyltransferase [Actinomadura logoneensis]|uniref:1-acyl-sn-glycerol-3-phosphate acyltransferase n=1 Tax=Actinomadura logoneensis TaxID=2293572 RepID=A0A372JHD5_9ACTN|nr:lysophospholipid acyltransferase family protein [Actinomadura logoneensis]RFU39411.1 1-acyl-sn-glycerol-3-phosphate acyltransferase [Actinomadura logoneensis]
MEPERLVYPLAKHVLLGPALRVVFRPKTSGRHHVPRSGPVILAANHLALPDSLLLPLVVPRQVFFLGKHEYFTRPGRFGRIQAACFRGVGAIAVDRSGGRAAVAAMEASEAVLRRGEVFALHPEGTRSPDGRLYRGHTGVGRLTLRTGAPVVPVGLVGTDRLRTQGRLLPNAGQIEVRFGEPMEFTGEERDREAVRYATDQVMQAIQKLTGQEYVDSYAPIRRRD